MRQLYPFFLAGLAFLSCLPATGAATGHYRDPIDTPALKSTAAQGSLFLGAARAGRRMIIVGERGHILYSDDQGRSWTQANVPSMAHLNAVKFADEQRGWAVGEDAVILRTDDGGENWKLQFDARDAELKGPLLDLWAKNRQEVFVFGVFNKILHSTDGGLNWEDWQHHIDNPDGWHLFNIAAVDEREIYISSEVGLIYVSRNGGKTFTPVQSNHTGSFHGVMARKGARGATHLVAFGVGGKLFTSLDGGLSWKEVDTGTSLGIYGGVWLEDGAGILVGAEGFILRLEENLETVAHFPMEDGLPLNAALPM